jgi:predicted Zn-dependent peptidase
VRRFFKTYYAPNNAVLAVVGDIQPDEARKLVQTYFGDIPAQPQPKHPEMTEPDSPQPRSDIFESGFFARRAEQREQVVEAAVLRNICYILQHGILFVSGKPAHYRAEYPAFA